MNRTPASQGCVHSLPLPLPLPSAPIMARSLEKESLPSTRAEAKTKPSQYVPRPRDLTHHEHRDARSLGHGGGRARRRCRVRPESAATAHDDQIALLLIGVLDDGPRRVSANDEGGGGEGTSSRGCRLGDLRTRVGAGRRHLGLGLTGWIGHEHVQPPLRRPREADRLVERRPGFISAVDCNDDVVVPLAVIRHAPSICLGRGCPHRGDPRLRAADFPQESCREQLCGARARHRRQHHGRALSRCRHRSKSGRISSPPRTCPIASTRPSGCRIATPRHGRIGPTKIAPALSGADGTEAQRSHRRMSRTARARSGTFRRSWADRVAPTARNPAAPIHDDRSS